jgi:hypothetical protein
MAVAQDAHRRANDAVASLEGFDSTSSAQRPGRSFDVTAWPPDGLYRHSVSALSRW